MLRLIIKYYCRECPYAIVAEKKFGQLWIVLHNQWAGDSHTLLSCGPPEPPVGHTCLSEWTSASSGQDRRVRVRGTTLHRGVPLILASHDIAVIGKER